MRPALAVLFAIALAAIAFVWWPSQSKDRPRPASRAELDPRPRHALDGNGERVRVYGTVSAGGKPLAGATIQLHDSIYARNPPVARVTTAAGGGFDLGETNLGEWTIVAYASGHQAVTLGAQPSPLRVALAPCRYPLRGHIVDTAGAAVRGAYLVQP